ARRKASPYALQPLALRVALDRRCDVLGPGGNGRYPAAVDAVGEFFRYVHYFRKEPLLQRGGIEPEGEELLVLHHEIVLRRLLARIGEVGDRRPGHARDELGEIAHAVRLGHLVEDLHTVAALRRVFERQLDATDGILDMDECA